MAESGPTEELETLQSIYTSEELTVIQEGEEGEATVVYNYNSLIKLTIKLNGE